MAISTIGDNGIISGTATSFVGTNVNFNVKVGDILSVNLPTSPSSDYAGILFNGGSYQNSFSVPPIGQSIYNITVSQPVNSFTITPVPNFATVSTPTGGILPNTSYTPATDGLSTIIAKSTSNTAVAYSTNGGVSFSNSGAITSSAWNLFIYNSSLSQWIAVSGTNSVQPAYSTNLTGAWTNSTGGTFSTAMTYGDAGGGNIVLGNTGTNQTAYSTNGTTWTAGTSPGVIFSSIKYVNNQFFGLTSTSSSTLTIYTSPTGVTWTARTITNPTTTGAGTLNGISYANGIYYLYFLYGSGVYWFTSTDGATWTYTKINQLYTYVNSPINFNGKFFYAVSAYSGQPLFGNYPTSMSQSSVQSGISVSCNAMLYCANTNTYFFNSNYVVTPTIITALNANPAFSLTNLSQSTYAGTF